MREADLAAAQRIFTSQSRLRESVMEEENNIYTEYKRGFPRFQCQHGPAFYVILFPDSAFHLNLSPQSTSPLVEFGEGAEHSREILDLFPASELSSLPIPRLPLLFTGLCRRYLESGDPISAIAAEQLVDGMDLDGNWCKTIFPAERSQELDFAFALVKGKRSRISEFSSNVVSCFIVSEEEAQRIKKIPGRV